jgi:hypothetical protein
MSKTVYVITLEGEPQWVYSNIESVRRECHNYLDCHKTTYSVDRDFNDWVEDRNYPNTEEGEELAWEDYKDEQFENGTWGDYAWYECYLD